MKYSKDHNYTIIDSHELIRPYARLPGAYARIKIERYFDSLIGEAYLENYAPIRSDSAIKMMDETNWVKEARDMAYWLRTDIENTMREMEDHAQAIAVGEE